MIKKSISLLSVILIAALAVPEMAVYADEQKMGRLIQTTTLEEDYQALVHLNLTDTPVLAEENIDKAYANVLCSAVRIQCGRHYGSGSIYVMTEEEIIVVSNKHVLQYFDEESYVTFWDGRSESGRIMGISREADVGFISISTSDFTYEELLQLKSVRKQQDAFDNVKENTCFFMIDAASDSFAPVLYTGSVIDKNRFLSEYGMEMIYGNAPAVPGMSGTGLFDCYGNYIGILSGGTEHNEIAGVPLPVIEEEYHKSNTPQQATRHQN